MICTSGIGTARARAGLIVAIVAAALAVTGAGLPVFLASFPVVPVVVSPVLAAIATHPSALALSAPTSNACAIAPATSLRSLAASALPVTIFFVLLALFVVLVLFPGLLFPGYRIIDCRVDPGRRCEGNPNEDRAPALPGGKAQHEGIEPAGVQKNHPLPRKRAINRRETPGMMGSLDADMKACAKPRVTMNPEIITSWLVVKIERKSRILVWIGSMS
jgi:hypothetical protein